MKNNKKALVISAIALCLASCIITPVEVFAERINSGVTPETIQNTLKTLRTEARAAHTAFVFTKCVNTAKSNGYNAKGKNLVGTSNWLPGSWTTGGTVNTGAWLEAKIQKNGEAEDGAIYCDENNGYLFEFFADQIGTTAQKLACDNSGGPGIFYQGDKPGSCSTSNNKSHYITSNWENHVAQYYDKYAEENNWLHRFSEISGKNAEGKYIWEYPEVIGYTMYVAEIDYGCGHSTGSTPPASGSYISVPVKTVNEYGEVTDEYYRGVDSDWVVPKTTNWGEHQAFVTAAFNYTCKEMVEGSTKNVSDGVARGANTRYQYFQEEVFKLIRDGCEAAYELQYKAAEENIAKDNVSDEKKEKLQSAIDEYNAMNAAKEFTEPTEKGGLQCKDTEFLTTVTQEAWTDTDLDDPDSGGDGGDCYTNAASLGWIMCPLIEQMSTMIQDAYEDFVTPFLVLDPELFDNSSDTSPGAGTFQAWGDFRNFANILFIILFIFVIFSQLTGMGIDNYGIKKILPKLIIGAILINLSYIICQLCIDVANIVGYGIGGIFNGIATFDASKIYVEGGIIPQGLATGVGILIALVAAFTVGAVLIGGPAVLIPILMGLLSILIGVLFCFVLLAVRKAFAVVLVVVSPIAFACYMLPNTKSIFDKWFNGFKAVLLAFPVCSAMIYGGQMVARILIMATGASKGTVGMPLAMAISAAVISIVPIFMIPKVLQGSMGAISAGIAGMRARANGRARGAVARSGWAQDKQRATMEMRNRRAAGVKRNGEQTWRSRKLYDKDSTVGKLRRSGALRHVPIVGISAGKDQRVAAARGRVINDMDVRAGESYADGKTYDETKFDHEVANLRNSKAFAEITGGNNPDTMEAELRKLCKKDGVKTHEDKVRRRALAQAMASGTSETKKKLADVLRSDETDGKAFAEFAKDSTIRDGVGDKDAFVADALRNASAPSVESYTFGEWDTKENEANVVKNVLDKNNLFSQSKKVQEAALDLTENGKHIVSDERLQDAVDNDNLEINDEMRDTIKNKRSIVRGGQLWSRMSEEQKKEAMQRTPRKKGESTEDWMKRIKTTPRNK